MTALLLGHIGIGLLGFIGIFTGGRRLGKAYNTIRKQAISDELTGVPNRRSFSERIAVELNRSHRDHEPLSLIMIDIDYFKYFNDHVLCTLLLAIHSDRKFTILPGHSRYDAKSVKNLSEAESIFE